MKLNCNDQFTANQKLIPDAQAGKFTSWSVSLNVIMNHAYPGPINHHRRKMSLGPLDESKSAHRTEPVFAVFSLSVLSDMGPFRRDEQINHLTVSPLAVAGCSALAGTIRDGPEVFDNQPTVAVRDKPTTTGRTMRSALLIFMQFIFNAILARSHNNLLHYQIPAR